MKRKQLILLTLLVLLWILSGCGSSIRIMGQVVDQHGHPVEGITVTCPEKGAKDLTDASGRFYLTVPDVEGPTNVNVTFDGKILSFDILSRGITLYKGLDAPMGQITLYRSKALVTGTVTNSYTTESVQPMSTNPLALPTLQGKPYADGEIIVKFKDTIASQSISPLASQLSHEIRAQVVTEMPKSKFVTLKTAKDVMQTIQELQKRSDVEFAEPNYYVYPLSVAHPAGLSSYYNDPYYNHQWNLQAINVENAWNYGAEGSSDVLIAVLDTGIKKGIADLDRNILWELGKDIVDHDNDPSVNWDSHGTYVASIIGAVPGNGTGIAGINRNVSIVPIRILHSADNDSAWGKTSELIEGLEYAIYDADVDIINLSVAVNVSGSSDMRAVSEILDQAEANGVLVVAAAGNEGATKPTFPARYSTVLAVGAVGPTLQPAKYSNKGVDLYAPGGDYYVYPACEQNGIIAQGAYGVKWVQGTSLASAHVAGVAALVLAEDPHLSPAALRARLRDTSLHFGYDDGNAGLIDAYRAVTNREHGRIFVFFGQRNADTYTFQTEESTYAYYKDDKNYFQLSNVNPGSNRKLFAWVDRDASGDLSYNDLFAEKQFYVGAGDEINVNLNLSKWY